MRSLWLCVGDRLGEQEWWFRWSMDQEAVGVERIEEEAEVHAWDLQMWDHEQLTQMCTLQA